MGAGGVGFGGGGEGGDGVVGGVDFGWWWGIFWVVGEACGEIGGGVRGREGWGSEGQGVAPVWADGCGKGGACGIRQLAGEFGRGGCEVGRGRGWFRVGGAVGMGEWDKDIDTPLLLLLHTRFSAGSWFVAHWSGGGGTIAKKMMLDRTRERELYRDF